VAVYRLYGCNAAGRIVFGDFVECDDQAAALGVARGYLDQYPIVEMWDGKRLLFRISGNPDGPEERA
jgi:hypothetical protein